ncbi:MAG: response regulator transcription factor [Thermoanaerobaculia bacterium]
MKILVVDDDFELRSIVGFALRQGGFLVVEAGDFGAALAAVEAEQPALVVLDLNLPGGDGLTLLPDLRKRTAAPVLVLSVRSAEEDVVRALDLGADDYLTKPFSPRTLLARIRALLRRAGVERPEPLVAGDLALDLERRTARLGGAHPVHLTPLELRLLQLLVASSGETVTVERLLIHIWGSRGAGERQLLKQLVHRLRQKIEPEPATPRYLVTAAGEGYRFDPLPR